MEKISTMHIQIIGLGYIGLPSAAVIAKQGLNCEEIIRHYYANIEIIGY